MNNLLIFFLANALSVSYASASLLTAFEETNALSTDSGLILGQNSNILESVLGGVMLDPANSLFSTKVALDKISKLRGLRAKKFLRVVRTEREKQLKVRREQEVKDIIENSSGDFNHYVEQKSVKIRRTESSMMEECRIQIRYLATTLSTSRSESTSRESIDALAPSFSEIRTCLKAKLAISLQTNDQHLKNLVEKEYRCLMRHVDKTAERLRGSAFLAITRGKSTFDGLETWGKELLSASSCKTD